MQRIVPLTDGRDPGWVEVLWRPSLAGVSVPPLTAIRILASEGRSTQLDRAMIDGVVNWRARNADAGVLAINVNPHVLVQPGFAGELRPYQREGLRWLWYLRTLGLSGCLADDMGMGKTLQVLALLLLYFLFPR